MPGKSTAKTFRDIVVIGGSVNAMASLARVTSSFPSDYSATVLVALQRPAGVQPRADSIDDFNSPLPAAYARDGEELQSGRVYIAPPNQLMAVSAHNTLVLTSDPAGVRSKQAIDFLFLSAANAFGIRVVGVVLSGVGDDGTQGLEAITKARGVSIVQSPADSEQPSMPTSAILGDSPSKIPLLDDIPKAILQVSR